MEYSENKVARSLVSYISTFTILFIRREDKLDFDVEYAL